MGLFWSKISYAAWRDIPTTVVLCEKDVPYAEFVAKAAQADQPNLIDAGEINKTAGHFPMLSQPEWTANLLCRAAGENVELRPGK